MEHSAIIQPEKREGAVLPSVMETVARVALSLVLFGAVVGKLMDPNLFRDFTSATFKLGPAGADSLFLLTVCIEALLGAALLLLRQKAWPPISTGILFLAFAGVLSYAMIADVAESCGCFGSLVLAQEAKPLAITRNLLLAAVALLVGFRRSGP